MTNLDQSGADGQRTRIVGGDNYQQRGRAFVFLDSRQQTAYGTLRAYMNIGYSDDFPNVVGTSAAAVYANRAFIQLAGFTWGIATSYYDFFSSPATSYSVPWSSDTGDGGWKVAAYTAQFGNGVSGSLSFEEPRRQVIANASVLGTYTVGALPTQDELHVIAPDVVANLRVDQAWGSAQIMGALHEVGGGYYGTTVGGGTCAAGVAGVSGNTCSGHPDNKLGYALGIGTKINFPMMGPGDYFQTQFNYTVGAVRYAALTPSGAGGVGIFGDQQGSNLGVGFFQDGVYCGASATAAATATCPAGGSSVQLTTAWSVQAAYEHFWTPSLRTSVVGAYTDIKYDGAASGMMCANTNAGGANTIAFVTPANCGAGSFDWSHYSISSRTQWNITKDFYVGLEGYYSHLNTMSKGALVTYTASATQAQPTGIRTLTDQNAFVYRMRVHRDLVP